MAKKNTQYTRSHRVRSLQPYAARKIDQFALNFSDSLEKEFETFLKKNKSLSYLLEERYEEEKDEGFKIFKKVLLQSLKGYV